MTQESLPPAMDLRGILPRRFQKLSLAETRLLTAASTGGQADCARDENDKPVANNPADIEKWGPDRSIRADLIRWMCIDAEAVKRVDPRGINVYAARIDDELNVSFASVPFPLAFVRCRFLQPVNLRSIVAPSLDFSESSVLSIDAANVNVRGPVWFDRNFSSYGEIDLYGARIEGDLQFSGARLKNPNGRTVFLDNAKIGGSVFFHKRSTDEFSFSAVGTISLYGALIGGDLNCGHGDFSSSSGLALDASRAQVEGFVYLDESSVDGGADFYGATIKKGLTCDSAKIKATGRSALQCEAAEIGGHVLGTGFSAEGKVTFLGAHIGGDLGFWDSRFHHPGETAFDATRAQIGGSVFLKGTFSAEGEVSFWGANIGGALSCSGGTFSNPDGFALDAQSAEINRTVFLSDGFTAHGGVRLLGAQIKGDLDCNKGHFSKSNGEALEAGRTDIGGSIFMDNDFQAEGEVGLDGARVGVDLVCRNGRFLSPSGTAIYAEGADIKKSVLFDNAAAEGMLNFRGASFGGDLQCDGAHFKNTNGDALVLERTGINGSVFLRRGFTADGTITLQSSQIGRDLDCHEGRFETVSLNEGTVKQSFYWRKIGAITKLDLSDLSVGDLDSDTKSWPRKGNLELAGFVYNEISDELTDPHWRLEWLSRSDFSPQPYRQLAKALRDLGDDAGSKEVLTALEDRRRSTDADATGSFMRRWGKRTINTADKYTTGYGFQPQRAFLEMVALTGLGWIIFRRAQRAGMMVPSDKDAFAEFRTNGKIPDYYPRFSPLLLAIELCVPVVKLGQDEKWRPNPLPVTHQIAAPSAGLSATVGAFLRRLADFLVSPPVLRVIRLLMIYLGWLLAIFLLGSISGIVKTS
jgi:hypothetical protein